MILELKPEHQRILEQEILSGRTQEEILDRAFAIMQVQHDVDEWMLTNREELAAQIDEGVAQAKAGDLVDAEDVIRILREDRTLRQSA
jgi:predicted transcriptional regulator